MLGARGSKTILEQLPAQLHELTGGEAHHLGLLFSAKLVLRLQAQSFGDERDCIYGGRYLVLSFDENHKR